MSYMVHNLPILKPSKMVDPITFRPECRIHSVIYKRTNHHSICEMTVIYHCRPWIQAYVRYMHGATIGKCYYS